MMAGKLVLKKIKVSEIMIAPVKTMEMTLTVKEAISFLVNNKISGAPLVSREGDLISVVSEMDLMKLGVLEGMQAVLWENIDSLPRRDKLITIKPEASFAELFKLFLENNIRRVIVIDDSKKIVGIVARRDIIKSYLTHTEAD